MESCSWEVQDQNTSLIIIKKYNYQLKKIFRFTIRNNPSRNITQFTNLQLFVYIYIKKD